MPVDRVILLEGDLVGNLNHSPDEFVVRGVTKYLDRLDQSAKLSVQDLFLERKWQLGKQRLLVNFSVQLEVVIDEELPDLVLEFLILLVELRLLREVFERLQLIVEHACIGTMRSDD